MWKRNLLFLTACGCVAAIAARTVWPRSTESTKRWPIAVESDDLQAAIRRVNDALRRDWTDRGLAARNTVQAPDLAIARRLSLALMGTIPSLAEIRQIETLPAKGRLDTWLDYILRDSRYDEYVAERLARAYVGVEDGPFLIYRRRRFVAWLADQLALNRSYDALVHDLIGANGLWTDSPAVNFITVTITPEQERHADANRLAARVARSFLGVRLDCAQCHDHPFDPRWTQASFQGLAAFFGRTRQSFTGVHDVAEPYQVENRKTGEKEPVHPAVPLLPELLHSQDGTHDATREDLAAWVTHPKNRAFAREAANRAWALLFGRPLVTPIDSIPVDDVPPALDVLADDFTSHGDDWQRLIRVIAGSEAFRLDSCTVEGANVSETKESSAEKGFVAPETVWAQFPLTRLRPEQVVGSLLQAASLHTIDHDSSILVRFARATGQKDFVTRYGDGGDEEFSDRGGTIPQRLLMMNGELVDKKTRDDLLENAATRIAQLAPDDAKAVETAYLAVLTRRPTAEESSHFIARLTGTAGHERNARLADIYWTLLNATEFSWNH